MYQQQFASSSSDKIHTTTVTDDGKLGCTCTGWIMKRGDKPRECKHTKAVVAKLGATVEVRDGYQYAVARCTTTTVATTTKAQRAAVKPPVAVTPVLVVDNTTLAARGFVNPQLAEKLNADKGQRLDQFVGLDRYIAEEKFDGHRIVFAVSETGVSAWSRPGADSGGIPCETAIPAHILPLVRQLPVGTYDGELFVPGGQCFDTANLALDGQKVLRIFDVVRLLGQDITRAADAERRAYLDAMVEAGVLATDGPLALAARFPVTQAAVDAIFARGGEGIIIKDLRASYAPGRRVVAWIKIKRKHPGVFTITGFEAAKSGPCSIIICVDDAGIEARMKTLGNAWLRRFQAAPESFIGRRVHGDYETKTPSGKYRTLMFDRLEGE
jgi:hypothetical protein